MSEADSSTVMVIFEAGPEVSGKYMEDNLDIEASGHIMAVKNLPIGWHKKHANKTGLEIIYILSHTEKKMSKLSLYIGLV